MDRFLARVYAAIHALAELTIVFKYFGLTAAGIWAVALAVVGMLEGVPWYWVLVGAPISGAFLALLGFLAMSIFPGKGGPPHFKRWRGHDSYKLWIAACLWSERQPTPSIPASSPSYPVLQRLKAAIASGQLPKLSGDGSMTSVVTRSALRDFAKSIGEHPKFLD